MAQKTSKITHFRNIVFLLDVLKLAFTAFGGPQVHFTQMHKLMVKKKKYLTEDELKELNSLCSMLPGPTSTQTITAIGFKIGGPSLAFFTLGVWVLPASMLMLLFALVLSFFNINNPKLDFLKFIQPMAIGFIVFAAFKITELFVTKNYHWILVCVAAIAGIYLQTPYYFPFLLLLGGSITSYVNTRGRIEKPKPIKHINWENFLLFLGVFLFAALLGGLTQNKALLLFENSYRYGSIVFGGGHVLIPMMYNQFVEFKHYINPNEFIAGVGFLQALPGPVFSISSFTGAMVLKDWGIGGQFLGGFIGTVGIFLPGALLIFFVYPIWNQMKSYPPIKNAIEGINVASAGLVVASAYILFRPLEINEENMIAVLLTLFLLLSTKIPYPIIVLFFMIAGFII
jgi:chromate transporter